MAFIEAITGPPPVAPVPVPHNAEVSCAPDEQQPAPPRAYLLLTIRNHHAYGTPPLANTALEVTVGATPTQNVTTDGMGRVTFVYEAAGNFAAAAVTAVVAAATRRWPGAANTANAVAADNIHQLAVTVRGEFQVTILVRTLKPAGGETGWVAAWSDNLRLTQNSTPPGAAAANATPAFGQTADVPPLARLQLTLDCVTAHELSVPFHGFVAAGCAVRVNVDAAGLQDADTANDTTVANVTYRRVEVGNVLRLSAERHDAAVEVRFVFAFPQVLIVGEGDRLEYALALATKYGDALHARGFQWIVATQYDLTDIAALPTDTDVLRWDDGVTENHVDLRTRVQTAQTKNLIVRTVQFDVTVAQHWTDALNDYGRFDAVIFNNPHPGYGLHMCEVMGMTDQDPHARKNGRAISVFSFGRAGTLTDAQTNRFRRVNQQTRLRYDHQRSFVREAADANDLNYRNDVDTVIQHQYDSGDSTSYVSTIEDAFDYADDYRADGILRLDPNLYGTAADIPGDRILHYHSEVVTIGMQTYLLRAYRHHGRGVLKPNSHIYIHGSTQWNAVLTATFTMAGQLVAVMTNVSKWPDHGTYFVHYRTNFTSTRHHPSWHSDPNFTPGEPNIVNARCYRWSN